MTLAFLGLMSLRTPSSFELCFSSLGGPPRPPTFFELCFSSLGGPPRTSTFFDLCFSSLGGPPRAPTFFDLVPRSDLLRLAAATWDLIPNVRVERATVEKIAQDYGGLRPPSSQNRSENLVVISPRHLYRRIHRLPGARRTETPPDLNTIRCGDVSSQQKVVPILLPVLLCVYFAGFVICGFAELIAVARHCEGEERVSGSSCRREGNEDGDASKGVGIVLKFALPVKERQDSVFSGFQVIDQSMELVCIHDSATLVSATDIKRVLTDGWLVGWCCCTWCSCKSNYKRGRQFLFCSQNIKHKSPLGNANLRLLSLLCFGVGSSLSTRKAWKSLMMYQGTNHPFIVEHMKHTVFITKASYSNIKVTTPDDLLPAEQIVNKEHDCGSARLISLQFRRYVL